MVSKSKWISYSNAVKRYKCEHCPMVMNKPSALIEHIKTMHVAKDDRQFPCPYSSSSCFAKFVRKSDLKRHLLLHTDLSYTCDLCSKTFKFKHALKKHMCQHTRVGGYSFLCASLFRPRPIARSLCATSAPMAPGGTRPAIGSASI